jgi:phosphoserine phosphatase
MESALTTTPPIRPASSCARADLPLAVGPAIRTAFLMGSTLSPDSSMPLVATLISRPETASLSPALAARAAAAIGASGLDWLAEGIACDLALPAGLAVEDAAGSLRDAVGGEPVDIAVQESAGRRKRILIADMDSTMIDQECIDELADIAGFKAHVAEITRRSMNGEIAFEPALRERVALLKDLPVAVIDKVIAERITLAAGGPTLIATMNAAGAHCALVSGGFTAFTAPIAKMLGFGEHRGNTLLVSGERLAGAVEEPILGRTAKADALTDISGRLGLTPADAIAVGDGANDLDMLQLAGTGVALHAKPAVAAQASIRIDHGDLTALLFIQGYRMSEFAR